MMVLLKEYLDNKKINNEDQKEILKLYENVKGEIDIDNKEILNDKFRTMNEYREATSQIKSPRLTSRETLDNNSPSP